MTLFPYTTLFRSHRDYDIEEENYENSDSRLRKHGRTGEGREHRKKGEERRIWFCQFWFSRFGILYEVIWVRGGRLPFFFLHFWSSMLYETQAFISPNLRRYCTVVMYLPEIIFTQVSSLKPSFSPYSLFFLLYIYFFWRRGLGT